MWSVLTVLIGLDGISMFIPTAKIRWKQEIIVLAAVKAFLVTAVGCCSKADSKRVKQEDITSISLFLQLFELEVHMLLQQCSTSCN